MIEFLDSIIEKSEFILSLMFMGVAEFIRRKYEQHRTNKLSTIAQKLGLDFFEKGQINTLSQHKKFHLFNNYESESIKNEMAGYRHGLNIQVFGYQYSQTTGSGKNRRRRTYKQTVVSIELNRLLFPTFQLSPENWMDRVGQKLFGNDIDFEGHEIFSKEYTLRGQSEDDIRALFSLTTIEYFETHLGLYIEADKDRMIFYQPDERCKPEDISGLIDQAVEVFRVLEKQL